ncbi:MAG: hypothetical protein ACE5HE_06940 [Phycisphaerae bacterium]
MPDDLDARIEEAKQQLAERQLLQARLPSMQENLMNEAQRVRMLEYRLEQLSNDIKKLEAVTLASVMESVLGRREGRLAQKREEEAELQRAYDECVDVIATLDGEVKEIEEQLKRCGDVEGTYRSLCDQKQQLILAEDTSAAERLSAVAEELSRAKIEHHKLRTAIQTGEHLRERLHSMTRAAGRARNKRISHFGPGLIAAVATNAITRQTARGAVNRADEGLARFGRCLSELDLSGGSPIDSELLRLGPMICVSAGELSLGSAMRDRGAAGPFLDSVQEAIGYLKEKLKETQQQIRELEDEQRSLIENA